MELWLFIKLYLALPNKMLLINLSMGLLKLSISLFYCIITQHSEWAEVMNFTYEIIKFHRQLPLMEYCTVKF